MSPNARLSHRAKGGTQEDLRRHNLGTLLCHLHEDGPLSRAELTTRMGLNRSTIAALVSELVTLGAVREERPAGTQPGAGRPSLRVSLRPEHVQVLAADIGITRLVLVGNKAASADDRRLFAELAPDLPLIGCLEASTEAVTADRTGKTLYSLDAGLAASVAAIASELDRRAST